MSGSKLIYILGVGRNTIVTIDLAEACGYTIGGLYHYQNDRIGELYFGHKIIGSHLDLFNESLSNKCFAISVGDNQIRADLFHRIVMNGGSLVCLIHPSAVVSRYAVIGEGVHVHALSVIDPDTYIGPNSIVSSKSTILHGSRLGQNCFIAPDAIVGANCSIDDYAFVGLNATIISNKVKSIGKNSIVGAAAVVTKSVEENLIVYGMPAK